MMSSRSILFFAFLFLTFTSCTDSYEEFKAFFGDFELGTDRKIAIFDGTINSTALADLEEMLKLYDTVEEIRFENAEGSSSASNAFAMADIIRENNINTTVIGSGKISQLATYVFLGGEKRKIETDGQIGVSSWLTTNGEEASTLSEGDSAHEPYIIFLKNMGFTDVEAKAFYFFTLNAANSSSTYFLNKDDIENFRLLN